MGRFVRWQAIIALMGILLLGTYLSSINVVRTTVAVPAEGGILREGVVGQPQYLNPLLANFNPVDQDITGLIFEGLTQPDGLGNVEPHLAKDWSVSADGLTYVFVLREDVQWSDGHPFSSADVIFTLNLIRSEAFPGDPAWQRLWQTVELTQVDDYTVRFELQEPFPSFINYTSIGILPSHRLQNVSAENLLDHPFNLNPIGTGPFNLQTANADKVVLAVNPRYHGPRPRIEQVVFKFYPNPEAATTALERGEIDSLGRIPPRLFDTLQTQSDLQFFSAPLPYYDVVYLNLQQPDTLPFFQDRRVRRALLQMIDRQALIAKVLTGQGIPAGGPIVPWSWAYDPQQGYPGFDPQAAITLLEQAGWRDTDNDGIRDREGIPLRFKLLTTNHPTRIAVATYLSEQWQRAGVDVPLEVIADGLPGRLADREFEAVLVEAQLPLDPDLYSYWHRSQIDTGQNYAGWDDPEASASLTAGRQASTRDERIKFYYQFQTRFAAEVPALILYHPVYTYAIRNAIKNVTMSYLAEPSERFKTIADWYLLTRRVIEVRVDGRLDTFE